jgi:lipopolysaccharide export system permease protein
MTLLPRYLMKHVALTTLFISVAITLIIWLTQSLRLLDLIINGGAPMQLFGMMLLLTVPRFFEVILPLGLGLGIIYSFNKLSADSEIIVMNTTGSSPSDLTKGVLGFSAFVAVFVFFLSGWATPIANFELDRLRDVVKTDHSLGLLRPGVFNAVGDDTTIYIAQRLNMQDLRGVFIHFKKKDQPATTLTAKRGGLVIRDGKTFVIVVDGQRQEFNPETGALSILKFKRYSVDLSSLFSARPNPHIDPNERTLSTLWSGENSDEKISPERLISELHTRLSKPLLTLSLALFALVPFMSGHHNRRGQPWRIICITFGFVILQAINLASGQLAGRSSMGILLLYGVPSVVILISIAILQQYSWWRKLRSAMQRITS